MIAFHCKFKTAQQCAAALALLLARRDWPTSFRFIEWLSGPVHISFVVERKKRIREAWRYVVSLGLPEPEIIRSEDEDWPEGYVPDWYCCDLCLFNHGSWKTLDVSSFEGPVCNLLNAQDIEEHLRQAAIGGEPFAYVALGLDGFRHFDVNTGDELLDAISERLKQAVAPNVVARGRGDLFGAILRGVHSASAIDASERMRATVASSDQLRRITASVGVAWYSGKSRVGVRAVVEAAERCLFDAKAGGRDRVVATFAE